MNKIAQIISKNIKITSMFYLKREIEIHTVLYWLRVRGVIKGKTEINQASLAWTLETCFKTIRVNANPSLNYNMLVPLKVWGIVLLLSLSADIRYLQDSLRRRSINNIINHSKQTLPFILFITFFPNKATYTFGLNYLSTTPNERSICRG